MKKSVTEFKRDMQSNLGTYQEAIDIFMRIGLYEFLLQRALPHYISEDSTNYDSISLKEIGRVQGYNECITDMFEFKETYLLNQEQSKAIRPTFGGITHAVMRGDITEEEAKDLVKRNLKKL